MEGKGTRINPEVEVDGSAHLKQQLKTDKKLQQIWEVEKPKRELGIQVLRRRSELGWSQRELAKRMATSQSRIHSIESGKANPTLETMQHLASVLGGHLNVLSLAPSPEMVEEDMVSEVAGQEQETAGQAHPQIQGTAGSTTLLVLKFNDPNGADRVLIALQGMQERELITLEDAAIVTWPHGNRKPKSRELHSGAGAGWGAFWGFLIGMIFFVPWLGAAVGAGMGSSMKDVGIDDDFIKEVRQKVTEGTSALFALTSGNTAPDKVIDELKAYDFEIISTNLPEEQVNHLRESFTFR